METIASKESRVAGLLTEMDKTISAITDKLSIILCELPPEKEERVQEATQLEKDLADLLEKLNCLSSRIHF